MTSRRSERPLGSHYRGRPPQEHRALAPESGFGGLEHLPDDPALAVKYVVGADRVERVEHYHGRESWVVSRGSWVLSPKP